MNRFHEGYLSRVGFTNGRRNVERFLNLRAYDEAEPQLSEVEIESVREGRGPYRGWLFLTPARVCCKGQFRKVSLSMAAGYIYAQLCRRSNPLLRKLVPHGYIRGRHHGKRRGKFRIWDMRITAGGKEGIVQVLQQRLWTYERQRFDALMTQWDVESRQCVYFVDDPGRSARVRHIVFSDKSILERVRFSSFLEDCRSTEQPAEILRQAVNAEKLLLKHFLDAAYAEATNTHLEKVVPIPKVYEIAM